MISWNTSTLCLCRSPNLICREMNKEWSQKGRQCVCEQRTVPVVKNDVRGAGREVKKQQSSHGCARSTQTPWPCRKFMGAKCTAQWLSLCGSPKTEHTHTQSNTYTLSCSAATIEKGTLVKITHRTHFQSYDRCWMKIQSSEVHFNLVITTFCSYESSKSEFFISAASADFFLI